MVYQLYFLYNMFFVTFSALWSFTYFFLLTYTTFILTLILYTLPTFTTHTNNSFASRKDSSDLINGLDLFIIISVLYLVPILLTWLWSSPVISAWFGHLLFNSFSLKMHYLIMSYFILALATLLFNMYLSSRELYDFIITLFSFNYWIIWLFTANSLITTLFIIEVLSALIFLFIVTSSFSTNFFYRNVNFTFGNFFQNSIPYTFLQSLIIFFWISLIASLNLFVFTILGYLKLFTLDWFWVEHIFTYLLEITSLSELLGLGIVWSILIFSVFLKCGVAPVYIWKPKFFRGLPLHTICFYATFFYFFTFLFIITLVGTYLANILYYFVIVNIVLLITGFIILTTVLCESYYLKSFMAMSSILNSLLVLSLLVMPHTCNTFFWL